MAVVCLLAPGAAGAGAGASSLYRQAQKAEKAGEVVQAYLFYAQAAALEPANRKYWARSQALRTRAALQTKLMPPAIPEEPVAETQMSAEMPAEFTASLSEQELAETRRPLPPVGLQASAEKKSFDLAGDSNALWEKVVAAFGLGAIFDGDYQPVRNLRFRLDASGYREALHALENATASFLVPIGERLVLVARDTQQKRQELEHTIAVTVPIPHPVSVQEAQELARAVQQLMEIQRLTVDSQRRLVLIRDRVSKVRPALEIYRQMLHHRPQVAIEIEFLEVFDNSSLSYGVNLPGRSALTWLSRIWGSAPSVAVDAARMGVFGAGKSFFGLGLADAELFATMARSASRTLLKTEIRSVDGQAASYHIGDRYPIISTSYSGVPQAGGNFLTPPPAFNFEDLGVVLKITPKVHGMEDITLDLEAEFKVLRGESLNGIPVIANRKFVSKARVAAGEWAVLAGLLNVNEARSITGLAGLSQLPVLGPLVSRRERSGESGEALLVIRPRLLSLPATEILTPALWTGTESRPRLPL